MTDEVLIEELARALCDAAWEATFEGWIDASEDQQDGFRNEARAILPIIERVASNAAKAEREKLVLWLRDAIGDNFADAADEYLNVEAIVGGQAMTITTPQGWHYRLGDRVTKTKGSNWTGRVVGFYSTSLTPEGYAVESETERGSVQIYPVNALTKKDDRWHL